jgi:hypothetical protein
MFQEELGKIGLKLEEAYGTPGQGGMCPNLYILAHSNVDRETGFKRPLYAYRKPS